MVRQAVGRDEATDATEEYLGALEAEMLEAAEKLEFERAAALRDRILQLRSARGGGPARPPRQPPGPECPRPGEGQGQGRAAAKLVGAANCVYSSVHEPSEAGAGSHRVDRRADGVGGMSRIGAGGRFP